MFFQIYVLRSWLIKGIDRYFTVKNWHQSSIFNAINVDFHDPFWNYWLSNHIRELGQQLYPWIHIFGSSNRRYSEKVFFEILQNSQENTSTTVSFLIKLQAFIKKETLAQVFSCEFCESSKNTFFTKHLWATDSAASPFLSTVCLGGPTLKEKCKKVLGKWIPCPEWDECKTMIENPSCLAKCKGKKVYLEGKAAKKRVTMEVSKVTILP